MAKEVRYDSALVGKNLRLLRTINELTLEEISGKTGLSKAYISLLERGKRQAGTNDLRDLLSAYSYSLGRFISDIADEAEDYNYSPNDLVQLGNQQLLLDGTEKENGYYIKLLRPLVSKDDTEQIELFLPAATQSSEDYIIIEGDIKGLVISGTLLIVFSDDEFICREGETFRFDGNRPFLFRNYTDIGAKACLFIDPPAY